MLEHDTSDISEAELDAIEALENERERKERTNSLAATRYIYDGIADADAAEIRDAAARIRERHTNIVKNILATGKDLLMVKNKLKHGAFRQWLKAEFGWSDRTAQNYMQAARVFGGSAHAVEALAPASIYKLAAKNTPDHVRHSIIRDIQSGKAPSASDIEERIKAAKGWHGSKKRSAASNAAPPAITSTGTGTIGPDAAAEAQAREKAAKAGRLLKERLGADFPHVANWFSRIPAEALDIYKEELLKLAGTSASASSTALARTDEHEAANAVAA